ncbi:MAG: hypothetical protein IK095_09210 [Oscillospiraceae bacterium]|nr:hypothetical protein [Oscillospiraceae bacterium]
MAKVYRMTYAGHPMHYSFLYPATRARLRPLPRAVEGVEPDIRVSPEKIELGRNFLPPDASDDYVEYRCLIELTARALLRWHCSIFHSAAFTWRGRAWLLTGPSEVGKTTQYLNWQRLHPGEIQMISGDMPVLETRDDGTVWVHPSSWNGKEDLHSAVSAPLGGLVLLEQGPENIIEPLVPRDTVMPLLQQFIVVPETRADILALSQVLERMLQAVPAWKYRDLGDDASTELLRATLMASLEEGEG